jgi:hypothetical protein
MCVILRRVDHQPAALTRRVDAGNGERERVFRRRKLHAGRRADHVEAQSRSPAVCGDRDGPACPRPVAHQLAVDLKHARRVAVRRKEARVHSRDRAMPLGHALHCFGAENLILCERRSQADSGRVETKNPDGDRSGRVEKRGVRESVEPDARRDRLRRAEAAVVDGLAGQRRPDQQPEEQGTQPRRQGQESVVDSVSSRDSRAVIRSS